MSILAKAKESSYSNYGHSHGLPNAFFTSSAADLQWPELADLLDADDPQSSAAI